jgi:hypothetical protein
MPKQMQMRLRRQNLYWRQPERADWRMVWKSVAVFGALILLLPCKLACAQQAERPHPDILVAPTIMAQPGSQVLLAIKVGQPEALPKKSFISLQGLPPGVSLPGWQSIGSGSWAIPLFALPTLKADIPVDLSGRSQVTIRLIAIDGSLLAQAQTTLIVGSTAMPPATAEQQPKEPVVDKPAPAPNPPTALAPPRISAEERRLAEQLVAQGEKYLGDANIEVARQFFRRAADAGLAAAALRLAATYDPAELVHLQAEGVVANRAEARKWYERARELGAIEAEERLARLGPETR